MFFSTVLAFAKLSLLCSACLAWSVACFYFPLSLCLIFSLLFSFAKATSGKLNNVSLHPNRWQPWTMRVLHRVWFSRLVADSFSFMVCKSWLRVQGGLSVCPLRYCWLYHHNPGESLVTTDRRVVRDLNSRIELASWPFKLGRRFEVLNATLWCLLFILSNCCQLSRHGSSELQM